MSLPTTSTEERLKELKDAYAKLFSDQGSSENGNLIMNDYLTHYRRFVTDQSSSKTAKEERNEGSLSKTFATYEKFWHSSTSGPPRLRLRPLLEDLNKRGPIEKKNFMLQRMDELSATKPARIMDYVRKQYPVSDDSPANTFFILGDVHKCIREYLTLNGWIEKYSFINGYLYKSAILVEILFYKGGILM